MRGRWKDDKSTLTQFPFKVLSFLCFVLLIQIRSTPFFLGGGGLHLKARDRPCGRMAPKPQ